jgi:integrin beta 2
MDDHSYLIILWFRILFWTDWDATFPRIEAASMSGGGRHVVFRDMEIGAWPNGLTLDLMEKRVVWTDARWVTCLYLSI